MANQWFRLYHEFATDPKVQMMSEVNQRRLVMLMCIRCCNVSETFHDEEVAFQLRVSIDEWMDTKAIFLDKNFIDKDNKLTNWDKRQYRSDTSTERVRKFREKKKQRCNVSVTPPDTDTDTDTENNPPISPQGGKNDYSKSFEEWWKLYPRKVGKDVAYRSWKKIGKKNKATVKELSDAIINQVKHNHFSNNGKECIPNPSTWLNQGRWKDEIQTQKPNKANPTTYAQCQDAERRSMANQALQSQLQELRDGETDIQDYPGRNGETEHCPLIPENTD